MFSQNYVLQLSNFYDIIYKFIFKKKLFCNCQHNLFKLQTDNTVTIIMSINTVLYDLTVQKLRVELAEILSEGTS